MKQTTLTATPGVPECFVRRCGAKVTGFLSGFDRLRFRATLGMLFQPAIMGQYLSRQNVLLKDFKDYALGITERIKWAARDAAEAARRPEQYFAERADFERGPRPRHRPTRPHQGGD